jgi:hypothetical protein
LARRGWGGAAAIVAGTALLAGAGYWIRTAMLPRAQAQQPAAPAAQPAANAPLASSGPSDYERRVVAYIYGNEAITREELGEYLIERFGADKLETLVNKRIIEYVCREQYIDVNPGEIEAALAEMMQGVPVDHNTFINTVLARYKVTLLELKEDILKTKLMLNKLFRKTTQVTEEDIQNLYISKYGEKVECQLILWPATEEGKKKALDAYGKIRDNPDELDRAARSQFRGDLAATAGKVKPFGRHSMDDPNLERKAFRLQPGELSEVIPTAQGYVVLKCLRRYPADSVTLDKVRDELAREIVERKMQTSAALGVRELRQKAHAELFNKERVKPGYVPQPPAGMPRSKEPVALFNGDVAITREDLGEFLIARFGADKLEFLINKRIIDKECARHGLSVTAEEIDRALAEDVRKLNVDVKTFVKEWLEPHKQSLYEWREDVIRPRLLLARLCQDRVKVTEEDVQHAYQAEYGEQVECKIILWPPDQTRFAMGEYTQIRDNPDLFEEKAKHQACSSLAATGGRIPRFGFRGSGNPDMERDLFDEKTGHVRMQPGEISTLINTPEGNVVVKLVQRIPANTKVPLSSVRDKLTKEVFDKKVQIEMQTGFVKLREAAQPNALLRDPNKPVDLAGGTRDLMKEANKALEPEKYQGPAGRAGAP